MHVSDKALLEYPYKLVLGKQAYAAWQGELYPNCSTIEGAKLDQGPAFTELKIFNVGIELGDTEEMQDKITWVEDCKDGCLFNVEEDPTEHVNLAADAGHADILNKLKADLEELNKGIFRPLRGVVASVEACENGVAIGGYYGPFKDVEGWYSPVPPKTPGQAQMEAMLLKGIHAVNKQIVEQGLAEAVKSYAPSIRQRWMSSLDKCFLPTVAAEDDVIVV